MLLALWLGVVTALTADGVKFTHPLHHIGKTVDNLPLLAIDSFRHMYLWRHNPKNDLTSVYIGAFIFTMSPSFCVVTIARYMLISAYYPPCMHDTSCAQKN